MVASGAGVLASVAVSVSRGKKKFRPGHILALCGSGLQMSLQLGKAAGEGVARRVTNVWPLRAVVSIDADVGSTLFVVRLRREQESALEYRFEAESILARDALVVAVLRAASENMRYAIKSNFDWEKRTKVCQGMVSVLYVLTSFFSFFYPGTGAGSSFGCEFGNVGVCFVVGRGQCVPAVALGGDGSQPVVGNCSR